MLNRWEVMPPPNRRRRPLSPRRRCDHASRRSFSFTATTKACSISRRELITRTTSATTLLSILAPAAAAAVVVFGSGGEAKAEEALSEWGRVYLPIDPGVVLLDIAFVPDDLSHGFLLGTRQTILETKDGGETWTPRSIPSAEDEDFNYRFNSISFKGKERWIIGKPAILLYTSDSGQSWDRIPLSGQLPGDMVYIKATDEKSAEMVTDEGAIYILHQIEATIGGPLFRRLFPPP